MTPEAGFVQLVSALKPYLDEIVFVGGWAHRLYGLAPAAAASHAPLTTDDADILVPRRIQGTRESIRELLVAADFDEQVHGRETPPATEYRLRGAGATVLAEFIVAQQGNGMRRDGSRERIREVSGVGAQVLPFVDILLRSPWVVRLSSKTGFPTAKKALGVRIANPAGYVVHKVLVHADRKRESRAKDLLYVHDTLELLGPEVLRAEWSKLHPTLHRKQVRDFHRLRQARFATTADDHYAAAVIARETGRPSPPTAEAIARTCKLGLEAAFGAGPG